MRVVDDYAHNPTEIAAALRTARADGRPARRRLQPHVYERTTSSRTSSVPPSGRGRRGRDRRHRRPDAPREGVTGLVLDNVPAGVRRGWRRRSTTPRCSRSRGLALGTSSSLGVGEPWRIARAIVEGLAVNVESGVPLAKMTTIGTGGPARALAGRTLAELEEALRFAERRPRGGRRRARVHDARAG